MLRLTPLFLAELEVKKKAIEMYMAEHVHAPKQNKFPFLFLSRKPQNTSANNRCRSNHRINMVFKLSFLSDIRMPTGSFMT